MLSYISYIHLVAFLFVPPFQVSLSIHSIAAVVDSHCSLPSVFNSGLPRGSVLSPALFFKIASEKLNVVCRSCNCFTPHCCYLCTRVSFIQVTIKVAHSWQHSWNGWRQRPLLLILIHHIPWSFLATLLHHSLLPLLFWWHSSSPQVSKQHSPRF